MLVVMVVMTVVIVGVTMTVSVTASGHNCLEHPKEEDCLLIAT
jgi:hypothetical protein